MEGTGERLKVAVQISHLIGVVIAVGAILMAIGRRDQDLALAVQSLRELQSITNTLARSVAVMEDGNINTRRTLDDVVKRLQRLEDERRIGK